MEKLSSGLRINRAGDDAAGLAISEKMRGQINGLNQASSNSQDAISLIQTAEGALNETHSILQRMRTLAVQSATDTNTDDDRTKIQAEVDELAKEITRISNTTEFNTQNLLAGGLNDTFQIGANKGQNINLSVGAMDAKSLGVAGDMNIYGLDGTNTKISSVTNVGDDVVAGDKIVVTDGATATTNIASVVKSEAANGELASQTTTGTYTGSSDATIIVKIDGVTDDATGDVNAVSYSTDGGQSFKSVSITDGTGTSDFEIEGLNLTIADAANQNKAGTTYTFNVIAGSKKLQLQDSDGNAIGKEVEVHNDATSVAIGSGEHTLQANFVYSDLTADNDGITKSTTSSSEAEFGVDGSISSEAVTYKGINVSTQSKANSAIETINNAITKVSEARSKLGAYQNRLEHTINNLGTSSENLTSAESRIRDVDMASEMSEYSKNNILSQAAQAMLAQANTQPQQVLQLLR
jgi:flagellin